MKSVWVQSIVAVLLALGVGLSVANSLDTFQRYSVPGGALGILRHITPVTLGLCVALIATIFVFSGYWQKVKDQPAGMRFLNSLVYGISIDALVGPWTY